MPSPDHIEEMALIAMSRMQRELYFGWILAVEAAGQHEEAALLRAIAAGAETYETELELVAA